MHGEKDRAFLTKQKKKPDSKGDFEKDLKLSRLQKIVLNSAFDIRTLMCSFKNAEELKDYERQKFVLRKNQV